ncbi:hypothetical protein BSY17_3335 (plasmid) [Sphingobium sp. RAC03]|nr:hypothetical protein BSY17_3335 [Sphingobium sp. RAC03]
MRSPLLNPLMNAITLSGPGLMQGPLFIFWENKPMSFTPQTNPKSASENQQKGSPAPTGTRQRSASALRKAGRTAQGRFVMDPTHGCCGHIMP